MVARGNTPLQSEAGYIGARPKTRATKPLATHGRTIHSGHDPPVERRNRDGSFTPESCRIQRSARTVSLCQHQTYHPNCYRKGQCAGLRIGRPGEWEAELANRKMVTPACRNARVPKPERAQDLQPDADIPDGRSCDDLVRHQKRQALSGARYCADRQWSVRW
jgi:hypothetical protein